MGVNKSPRVLLCGLQKCGSTHVRFVIFNYYNILLNDAKETLTYRELTRLQWQEGTLENYNEFTFEEGFPFVCHTHGAADGMLIFGPSEGLKYKFEHFHEYFDKLVYIYRNPFDCMISYWHFMMDRDDPWNGAPQFKDVMEEMKELKGFVKHLLFYWINHVKNTKHLADLVLDYDELNESPLKFIDLMDIVTGNNVDLAILERAIEMSSFDSIREMGIKHDQIFGLASSYRGHFARDGRSGQYKEVMSEELQDYIRNECKKGGIDV